MQLTHDVAAVRNFFKGEDAVLVRFGGQQSVVLGEAGFVCAEESEQSAGDLIAGFTVDLITLDRAVDQLVGDFIAVVHGDVNSSNFLACVLEYHGVLLVGQDIVLIGADFLDIGFCTNGKVGAEGCIAVLVALNDLKHPAGGDTAAICRNDFLCGEQAEVDRGDFSVAANAEDLVLLHDLIQINLDLLALVVEAGGGFGNLYLLACVGQFHSLNGGIENHTIGGFRLNNMVSAQEERFGYGLAVILGNKCCHDLFLAVSESTVRRVDILRCGHGVLATCQTADSINQTLAVLGVHDGGEMTPI